MFLGAFALDSAAILNVEFTVTVLARERVKENLRDESYSLLAFKKEVWLID